MTAPAKSTGGQALSVAAASAAENGFVGRPENHGGTNLDSTSTEEIVSKHNAIAIGTEIETLFADRERPCSVERTFQQGVMRP